MNLKKILLVVLSLTVFVVVSIFSTVELTLKEKWGLPLVFLLGLHFIYGCLFNTEIHASVYTVPIGERPILRFGLFIVGLVIMVATLSHIW